MKFTLALSNLTLAALLSPTLAMAQKAQLAAPAGTYQIDPVHSHIGFEIPHLVISSVEGTFGAAEGQLLVADKFEASSVKASVKVDSINTNNADRDAHLKSADFFDAKKHPGMTFESTALTGTPQAFKLTGNLTIKGVTKKVTFDGKYTGTAADPFGNQKVAFTATSVINRKDFGLTWNKAVEAGPVVGDDVTIRLKIQAGRPLTAKK